MKTSSGEVAINPVVKPAFPTKCQEADALGVAVSVMVFVTVFVVVFVGVLVEVAV